MLSITFKKVCRYSPVHIHFLPVVFTYTAFCFFFSHTLLHLWLSTEISEFEMNWSCVQSWLVDVYSSCRHDRTFPKINVTSTDCTYVALLLLLFYCYPVRSSLYFVYWQQLIGKYSLRFCFAILYVTDFLVKWRSLQDSRYSSKAEPCRRLLESFKKNYKLGFNVYNSVIVQQLLFVTKI